MKHNYKPYRKGNGNSLLKSKFGGDYYTVSCSCGLFGCGKTPCDAMEHLNDLHDRHRPPTLLFVDVDAICLQLDADMETEMNQTQSLCI